MLMSSSSVSRLVKKQSSQGFTWAEVMVSGLIMVLLTINFQAMVVYSGMFRLKAKNASNNRSWIQQDLENVQFTASQFTVASLTTNAVANSASIDLNRTSVGGIALAIGDRLTIGTDPNLYTISSMSGTAISFTPNLKTAQPSGSPVLVLGSSSAAKLCNATLSNKGLAQALASDLSPVLDSSKVLSGVPYTLTRTATVVDIAPYQILRLSYSVAPSAGGMPIMSLQTEVIPNASFSCP